MKNFILLVMFFAVLAAVCFGFSAIIEAETRIAGGFLDGDAHWTRENSPYFLEEDLIIGADKTLTIGQGVEITSDLGEELPQIIARGNLLIKGTQKSPVNIKNIWGIGISQGQTSIEYLNLDTPGGISFESSTGVISTSTIANSFQGIYSKDSSVVISSSKIQNNEYGIMVQPSGGPFLAKAGELFGQGGIGNAIEAGVTISNSTIVSNQMADIINDDLIPVTATDNWWGSPEGPAEDRLAGPVEYNPWLFEEPKVIEDKKCCSSILFIPGLQASRLHLGDNQLWEPNRNEDVEKLFLDENGSTTNSAIYSDRPVDKALGMMEVYGNFMDFLDDLVNEKIVNEWKFFSYDWRKPIVEVVAGRELRRLAEATTTESLIETVDELAKRSPTGKVTLIAHSNGGLVAKYLTKTLVDLGRESLIDSFISVAVPYLGTPEAILGLLHGFNQSIAHGLILKDSVARTLGRNMPSAYSLLPSREYFSKVFTPTIVFASSTVASAEEQSNFIVDSLNSRIEPELKDTSQPIRGNNRLMLAASLLHNIIDLFTWPANIGRWAIVGWNIPTSSGIKYGEKVVCMTLPFLGKKCDSEPFFKPELTAIGDGTVVAPSATHNSGQIFSIDLSKASEEADENFRHHNILAASSTQKIIKDIVRGNNPDPNSLPSGVTIGEPDYSQEPTFLALNTYSPVELHVYDSNGRHTGLISALPDVEDEIITAFETKIPGSQLTFSGSEDDRHTHVTLPDKGQNYSVLIRGIGVGTFSFDIEKIRGREIIETREFNDLPVTPLTIATTTVSTVNNQLNVDVEGDGRADIIAFAGEEPDPFDQLEALKKTVLALIPNTRRAEEIIQKLDRMKTLIEKGKLTQAYNASERLKKRIGNKKLKGLSQTDRDQIVEMIEIFIGQYE